MKLEDEAQLEVAKFRQLARVERKQVLAFEQDAPRSGPLQAAQHVQ